MFEIGSTLREARERRQLGLDQAEAETKVRARYLRALEDEDFESIPGPTYVRGFLRSYAAFLGLEGQLFVDEYNSRFHPRADEAFRRRTPARERRSKRRESNAILIALAGIVAIAVLVIAAATYPRGNARRAPLPPVQPTTQPTVANPALPLVDPTTSIELTPTNAKPVTLVVVADRTCYVTVYAGKGLTGKILFSDQLDPVPDHDRWKSKKPSPTGFTIELGVENAVHVVINGQSHFLPSGTVLWVKPDGTVTDRLK